MSTFPLALSHRHTVPPPLSPPLPLTPPPVTPPLTPTTPGRVPHVRAAIPAAVWFVGRDAG